MRRIAPLLFIVLMTGCGGAVDPDLTGQQVQLEQQLSGVKRAQTATVQAQAQAATTEAKATRQALDQANAQATTEARQTALAQGATTATVQAHAFSLTVTADALLMAEQQAGATATADAQAIISAQQRQAATATAEAVEHVRVLAEQEAQQTLQVSAVMAWIAPAGALLAIAAIVGLLYRLASQWVNAHHERWQLDNQRVALMGMLLETRTGTVVFVGDPHAGYSPRLIGPMTGPAGHEFDLSQLDSARPLETLQVNTPRGTQFIAREDPKDAEAEQARKLALRLLRDAMQKAGAQASQIPTAKALGWQPNLWVRAVGLLKPHVTTRQGRGGGTFCAETFPTLQSLYAAIGEKRITPLSCGERAGSPANAMLNVS